MNLEKDKYIIVEVIPTHSKAVIQYDKEAFTYVDNPHFIPEKFKSWAKNLPLLIIEDSYTLDYLKDLKNKKELIYPYLNMEHSYDVFNKIMKKYNLEPSNHLVDLLYEAIIYESNNKEKETQKNERKDTTDNK